MCRREICTLHCPRIDCNTSSLADVSGGGATGEAVTSDCPDESAEFAASLYDASCWDTASSTRSFISGVCTDVEVLAPLSPSVSSILTRVSKGGTTRGVSEDVVGDVLLIYRIVPPARVMATTAPAMMTCECLVIRTVYIVFPCQKMRMRTTHLSGHEHPSLGDTGVVAIGGTQLTRYAWRFFVNSHIAPRAMTAAMTAMTTIAFLCPPREPFAPASAAHFIHGNTASWRESHISM